jgi:hypothetical protein
LQQKEASTLYQKVLAKKESAHPLAPMIGLIISHISSKKEEFEKAKVPFFLLFFQTFSSLSLNNVSCFFLSRDLLTLTQRLS